VPFTSRVARSLAVSALVLTSACAAADNAPAVGTVAVTTPETRVPVGSPLTLTYRFQLNGTPLTSDYTVFAHFVNADGQILWSDDHRPPVPTAEWKPGTPIEYTRTVFLPPATLHPGDVGIEVGLYRDGERLPLEGLPGRDNPARSYRVLDLQLAPESENVFLIYQNGWHQDEFAPDAPNVSWKWTEQTATVAFRNPRTDAEMLIEYSGRPDYFRETPQQVTVIGANNERVATFPIESREPVQRRVSLTSAQMGTAELTEIRFEVDRTFVPAQQASGGQDERVLGFRVFNLYLSVP
jgi:hypothetical protein